MSDESHDRAFDYIVVGSGAGGGPLAANLARTFRVLLLEAGGASEHHHYSVPAFHGLASEDADIRWDFFVNHYDDETRRRSDSKYCEKHKGVLYPRASTLGGCTAHNAMITIVPHDSDWNGIAELTGDVSWRAEHMHKYFERLECCGYVLAPGQVPAGFLAALLYRIRRGVAKVFRRKPRPSGHGFKGWLHTNMTDPKVALPDERLLKLLLKAARVAARRGVELQLLRVARLLVTKGFGHFDPNDARERQSPEGLCLIPMATNRGCRNGSRELINRVKEDRSANLVVRTDCLVTRVLFENSETPNRATGVEYMRGSRLYRADRERVDGHDSPKRETVQARREVILSAGAYNTPQLLMLSGIGPRAELEKLGIDVRVDLPGVGRNLQDRYEVGVVSEMKEPFELLGEHTFAPPVSGQPEERAFTDWRDGKGVYTSNGAVIGISMRSTPDRPDPDLFIFGLPGFFKGYFPGYSAKLLEKRNYFTWAVLKAHTNNTGGIVTLRTTDPRDPPDIVFRYFDEGTDTQNEDDLEAVVYGVLFARSIMKEARKLVKMEKVPGEAFAKREDLRRFVRDEAWGHHASCSSRIGPRTDPFAVVDSRFRVHGTKGLRVVDASVFPRIPGFFIVTAVYMISEKASDVILQDSPQYDWVEAPVPALPRPEAFAGHSERA